MLDARLVEGPGSLGSGSSVKLTQPLSCGGSGASSSKKSRGSKLLAPGKSNRSSSAMFPSTSSSSCGSARCLPLSARGAGGASSSSSSPSTNRDLQEKNSFCLHTILAWAGFLFHRQLVRTLDTCFAASSIQYLRPCALAPLRLMGPVLILCHSALSEVRIGRRAKQKR